MKVFIEKTGERKELLFNGKGVDLCEKLNINIETIIIVRNGSIITEDILLEDSDNVDLLSVISGG